MTPGELLARLRARGVRITKASNGLDVDAPKGALTSEDRELLRQHAPAILSMVRADPFPTFDAPIMWGQCWRDALEDRMAIMLFDDGIPGVEIERRAVDYVRRQRIAAAAPYLAHPHVRATMGPMAWVTVEMPDGERVPVPVATGGTA